MMFPFGRFSFFAISGLALTVELFAIPTWASGYNHRTLHTFCAEQTCTTGDGTYPYGALLLDPGGTLYGTTKSGGADGGGTVFSLTRNSQTKRWNENILYSFCSKKNCSDGQAPIAELIEDVSGNLYGTTSGGGSKGAGTVFRLSPSADAGSSILRVLHDFSTTTNDGYYPAAGLTYSGAEKGLPYDGNSPLYGTTEDGGKFRAGTAFQIIPVSGKNLWRETIIHHFGKIEKDGAYPEAALLVDESGNLYGTASSAGSGHGGMVFELSPDTTTGWTETRLYSFCTSPSCPDGEHPESTLIFDAAGNLYGTTVGGGTHTSVGGTVFRLARNNSAWQETVLYSFCAEQACSDGTGPAAGLVMDAHQNLYGTTAGGGLFLGGVVFEVGKAGTFHDLHNFNADSKGAGADPYAKVVLDGAGNLFGTTVEGPNAATFHTGDVFELVPSKMPGR